MKEITKEEIAEKTAAGLTKDQAVEVITNQRSHDEGQEKAAADAEKSSGKKNGK